MTADGWVEDWLSSPRFAVYLATTEGDRNAALELYGSTTTCEHTPRPQP
ncbi:hypothetical protein [Pseudonocardia sp. NPDC049154]